MPGYCCVHETMSTFTPSKEESALVREGCSWIFHLWMQVPDQNNHLHATGVFPSFECNGIVNPFSTFFKGNFCLPAHFSFNKSMLQYLLCTPTGLSSRHFISVSVSCNLQKMPIISLKLVSRPMPILMAVPSPKWSIACKVQSNTSSMWTKFCPGGL